jgi:16S rRNA G966 N2-methylase RsmD
MMDPPYADPAIEQILCLVAAAGVGREGGLVIVGHSPRVTLAESYPGLERIKFRRLGDSCFSIYELAGTFEIPPEPSVEATAFLPDLSGL